MTTRFLLIFILLFCNTAFASDEIPGVPQSRPIALIGADIYPVIGPAIPGGTVVFTGGKITALGRDVSIPSDAESIDAKGKRVYPALFEPMSDIGLTEIEGVRATRDHSESGSINPNS